VTADVQLDTLEAKGLIRVAAIQPELEYLFRHALVQDAAYGSLLKQERRALHARVAEALEALYPQRRSELAAVLAMHFEQAGETDKAVAYLIDAGEYGYRRFAIREAYDAFDRAAQLLVEGGPDVGGADDAERRRTRIRIELGKAEAGFGFRSHEELLHDLEGIVTEAEALGDPELLLKLHVDVALGWLQQGRPADDPVVARSLSRIESLATTLGEPSLAVLPIAIVGMSEVFAGSPRVGVQALEDSVPRLERGADTIGAAFARGALAIGYAILGEFDKATDAAANAKAVAEKGDLIAQIDARIAEAVVQLLRGDLDVAVLLARECVERSEATGAMACVMPSSWVLGDALHRLGQYAEAREILQRGTEISGLVDRKVWRPTLQAWLGSTLAALGEDGSFDEALETARSIHNSQGEAQILAKRAEAAAIRKDWGPALADFETSAEIMAALGARPSLARVLQAWGETLRAAGRPAEAEPILRRSLQQFDELGLEREARAVRTNLSLGAPLTFG
jgi:tetratricopeptide (TPR) repeat protein